MNSSFINSLLELVLSWVRGIISDVWTMLSGDSGSFFAWLGRHWLSLVCILVIGGITADLVFYILRWHPQRVWYSKLDRLLHRSAYKEEEMAFDAGYDSGIESFYLDSDPVISQYVNGSDAPELAQYEVQGAHALQTEPAEETAPVNSRAIRRRRSERHGKRIAQRRIRRLSVLEDNGVAQYSYPAPPVHAREAFHNAVYPSADQAWEQKQHADE